MPLDDPATASKSSGGRAVLSAHHENVRSHEDPFGDHVKRRLVRAGLQEERCSACGIVDWLGARLALELHHVTGVGDDNQLENLTPLCPNCHSQTGSRVAATGDRGSEGPLKVR